MKKFVIFSIVFCFLFSFTAQAKSVWDMAESEQYGEKAGGMLGRGLLNAATCFVDMPVGAVNGAKRTKPEFLGGIGGFATGAACTVFRAASGVLDVATFWIPGFHGIPICRTYGDCFACTQAEEAAPTYAAPAQPQAVVYQQPASQPQPVQQESRMKYVKK